MHTLNLGILAHVDAGKTSLTERILFAAGVIRTLGDVDHGTTQTDTMELERQRGISIQSAVTSFTLGDHTIDLIDTPGHPDFIAEVERALRVLDGVILVISAVEGVQPQTRKLVRAIRALALPCLIMINKIDRVGARSDALLREISDQLAIDVVPLNEPVDPGTHAASTRPVDWTDAAVLERAIERLASHAPSLLDAWAEHDGHVDPTLVRNALRRATAAGTVFPAVFGSAMTGAGIDDLLDALTRYTPEASGDPDAPLRGEVFKVLRAPGGERLVFARIRAGTIRVREPVEIFRPSADAGSPVDRAKVTGIDRFHHGTVEQVTSAGAGDIVRLHGLACARIGDWLGGLDRDRVDAFPPPVFESRIQPVDPKLRVELNAALAELADQDPLIGTRHDTVSGDTFIRLYGDVQREVIESTLAGDYGVAVAFGEPRVLCVERLRGEGRAAEIFPDTKPPLYATVGFRIAPKRGERSHWTFTPGKAKQGYFDAAEEGGRSVLAQGIHGWPVIDWDVEVTDLIFLISSVASDYRKLAMLVMADAIRDAGTVVCEPVHDVTITVPPEAVGAVIHALTTHRGEVVETTNEGERAGIRGTIPAAGVDALTRALPGLTNGLGDIETQFRDYAPIDGPPPTRARTDYNPFDRTEFMSRLAGRF
jgi:ribosomal protection tetracycline resistance protein